jgi:hypothetical protein
VVILTGPAGGTVSGSVTIAANANDDIGVAGVQFLLDGRPIGAEITAAPYAVEWIPLAELNGEHIITVVARDAAGNQSTAVSAITVANELLAP